MKIHLWQNKMLDVKIIAFYFQKDIPLIVDEHKQKAMKAE